MALRLDLTGRKVGKLTVVSLHSLGGKAGGKTYWNCLCECGNETIVLSSNLVRNHTTSCGCFKKGWVKQNKTTHGGCGTKEYFIYRTMINRCTNPKVKSFVYYGARGIRVCDRWLGVSGFLNFMADIGPRPSPIHSVDRYPNFNGDYSPENTRWATPIEQGANTRKNVWLEYNGEVKIMSEWGRIFNLNLGNLGRMMKKKTFEECINYYLSK